MVNIARRTGDTVFLIIRIGDFAHCLHVEPGSHPLHAHSLMTGQIRLLGQGTANLALAATLRDKELDQIYQRRRPWTMKPPASASSGCRYGAAGTPAPACRGNPEPADHGRRRRGPWPSPSRPSMWRR